jgi:hypothetical protein
MRLEIEARVAERDPMEALAEERSGGLLEKAC